MRITLLLALAMALGASAPAVSVTAGESPETAPFVGVGQTLFGNTDPVDDRTFHYQFARIPLLYAGDELQTRGQEEGDTAWCLVPARLDVTQIAAGRCGVLESELVSPATRLTIRPERRGDRFSMLALYDYGRSGLYQLQLVAIRRRAIVALPAAVRMVPGGRLSVPVRRGDGVSPFHDAPLRARLWLREADGAERPIAGAKARGGRLRFAIPADLGASAGREARIVVLAGAGVQAGASAWRAVV